MKLALRIIYSDEDLFDKLQPKAPKRPWYARNLRVAQRSG